MPSDANRRAHAKWRTAHPEKARAAQQRHRLHRRWAREFAKMGVSYRDLVPVPPTDVVPWMRSEARDMMDAYEAMLACQSHMCVVCRKPNDLNVPVWDTHETLVGFACEACRPYVQEEN